MINGGSLRPAAMEDEEEEKHGSGGKKMDVATPYQVTGQGTQQIGWNDENASK